MADIQRGKVIQLLAETAQIQGARDEIPKALEPKVRASIDLNPKYTDFADMNSQTTSGTQTLQTIGANQAFFLTYVNINVTKDATSDLTTSSFQITQNGVKKTIVGLRMQTTTAGSFVWGQSFPHPIRCDPNSTIVMTGTFTVGTCTKAAQWGGFFLE